MDDDREPTTPGSAGSGSTGDESFGWTGDESTTGGNDARAAAERMLAQLQAMIDQIATQAAPVVRQIGAKAAELAAVAADRAGPLAHRAADATAEASVKIAERSRTFAADLRSRTGEGDADGHDTTATTSDSVPLQGVDDATEMSAKDDPAEGRPL